MLHSTIKYKLAQIGGVFVEVPTRQVKPSQTCPKCGHKHKKTLDIRIHECGVCNYIQYRDIAAAEVMLYWARGILPGLGTNRALRAPCFANVAVDVASSTASTSQRQQVGSMQQLGQKKRQKSQSNSANNVLEDVETSSSGGAS